MRVIKKIDETVLAKTIERCRERKIVIPTFAEQADPTKIPEKVKRRLKDVGMQDANPLNLFRITWMNEPKAKGGLYNQGNWIEFPSEVTGVS
ncbi:MAG: pyridoxal-5'-phosphate-dependent protein subunit beta, partial [bacterium]